MTVVSVPSPAGHKLLEVGLGVRDLDGANALPTRALVLRTSSAKDGGAPAKEAPIGCSRTHGDTAIVGAPLVAAAPSSAALEAGPVHAYRFDACAFGECGEWHHVVFTHSKGHGVRLCVDGLLLEATSSLAYPELPSSRAARAKSPAPPSESVRFSGQLASMLLTEGCWDMHSAARLFERGATHTDTERSLRTLGIEGYVPRHRVPASRLSAPQR